MLIEKLHPFFGKNAEVTQQEEVLFTYADESNKIILRCNEYDELTIMWNQADIEIVKLQNIVVADTIIIEDEFETYLQFIPEDKSSRMYKVQLKPYIKVSYELYFEVCEGCEEE